MLRKPNKCLIVFFTSFICLPSSAETLEQLVNQAIGYSQTLKVKDLEARAANQTVREAVGEFLPKVDISAGVGYETSQNPTTLALEATDKRMLRRNENSANVTQNLFAGWRDYYNVKQGVARTYITKLEYENSLNDLAYEVIEAFYEVIRNQQLLNAATYHLHKHEYFNQLAHQQARTGISRDSDFQQARERLMRAKSIAIEAKLALSESKNRMQFLTGKSTYTFVWHSAPKSNQLPRSLEQAASKMIIQNPKLRSLRFTIDEGRYESKKSLSGFFPEVNLEISHSKNRNLDGLIGPNNDDQVMLRASYNVLNGGMTLAASKQALYSWQSAHHNYTQEYRALRNEIYDSWQRWITLGELVLIAHTKLDTTKTRTISYQRQFRLGERTLLDLLDVEYDRYQARADHINAVIDENVERYRILYLVGELPARFTFGKPPHKTS